MIGSNDKKLPYYMNITGEWYKGNMPHFYDENSLDSTRILRENYQLIKDEILKVYEGQEPKFKPNFTPYKYKEEGWRTLNLIAFSLEYRNALNLFPEIEKVIRTIPGLITAQVAVLSPRTRIKAHFGDTDALIRSHLGVVIPGKYPDLGFRNGSEEKGWVEGDVMSFCIAHRHYAWNNSDGHRIILLIDTIRPDYSNQKIKICADLLAAAVLKLISNKINFTKQMPLLIVRISHFFFSLAFQFVLRYQTFFRGNLIRIWNSYKLEV